MPCALSKEWAEMLLRANYIYIDTVCGMYSTMLSEIDNELFNLADTEVRFVVQTPGF